jgi:hypothetical protein
VPSGDFGLTSEIGTAVLMGGLPALEGRDGVDRVGGQVLTSQAAQDGKYPDYTVPSCPASGS